jgi:hypothetical protein
MLVPAGLKTRIRKRGRAWPASIARCWLPALAGARCKIIVPGLDHYITLAAEANAQES